MNTQALKDETIFLKAFLHLLGQLFSSEWRHLNVHIEVNCRPIWTLYLKLKSLLGDILNFMNSLLKAYCKTLTTDKQAQNKFLG